MENSVKYESFIYLKPAAGLADWAETARGRYALRPAKRRGPVDGWIARAGGSGVDRRERGAGDGHEARERLLHCGGRGGLVRRGRLPACPRY